MPPVTIRYESIEAWEQHRDAVRQIIAKHTGREFYPETKSLPPIGLPGDLHPPAIEELKALKGVIVDIIH
ncbi:hypothetical protein DFH27DRAFT_91830 [Peziza echinospora]|nr:hypothetical protein DFH27DRAFT_91830 [Peziza echinospora]